MSGGVFLMRVECDVLDAVVSTVSNREAVRLAVEQVLASRFSRLDRFVGKVPGHHAEASAEAELSAVTQVDRCLLEDHIARRCQHARPADDAETGPRGDDRAAQVRALREAAQKWQWSVWAAAPRCADRIQERIANGQYVTDWLRSRADAIEAGATP